MCYWKTSKKKYLHITYTLFKHILINKKSNPATNSVKNSSQKFCTGDRMFKMGFRNWDIFEHSSTVTCMLWSSVHLLSLTAGVCWSFSLAKHLNQGLPFTLCA